MWWLTIHQGVSREEGQSIPHPEALEVDGVAKRWNSNKKKAVVLVPGSRASEIERLNSETGVSK